MDIRIALSNVLNAETEQLQANIVHDYKAQTESVIGELTSRALINQAVVYKFTNLPKRSDLGTEDLLVMEAEYVKAKGEFSLLKLDKIKAEEFLDYLNNLAESLPKPKLYIEQVLESIQNKQIPNKD